MHVLPALRASFEIRHMHTYIGRQFRLNFFKTGVELIVQGFKLRLSDAKRFVVTVTSRPEFSFSFPNCRLLLIVQIACTLDQ